MRDLGHDFSLGFPSADSLHVGHEAWSIVISPVRVLLGLLCIVVPTYFASVRFYTLPTTFIIYKMNLLKHLGISKHPKQPPSNLDVLQLGDL